jgi:uncharacterized protein
MPFADLVATVPINACETVSGRYVDVVSPDPKTIEVTDIAWALSRQARFAGHTMSEEIWNVAQHCVFVVELIELVLDPAGNGRQLHESLAEWLSGKTYEYACDGSIDHVLLHALMHDAAEAYLIDLPSPVKRHPALRGPYKELEVGVNKAIFLGLNMPPITSAEHEIIVWADLLALQIEAANLMPSRGRGWSGDLPIMNMVDIHLFPHQVKPWKLAYEDFMSEYHRFNDQIQTFLPTGMRVNLTP